MPRSDICQFGHEFQDLFDQHRHHAGRGGVLGAFADRRCRLHELHHPGPLKHRSGELPLAFDEQFGDRHFQHLLPLQQIRDPEITVGLLLSADRRQRCAQPPRDIAERHALKSSHFGNAMQLPLLTAGGSLVCVPSILCGPQGIRVFDVCDRQRVIEHVVVIVVVVIPASVPAVNSGHGGILLRLGGVGEECLLLPTFDRSICARVAVLSHTQRLGRAFAQRGKISW